MAERILPRHLSGALITVLIFLAVATLIEASDNSSVNFGANSNITAFSTCKKVTNDSGTGLSVYVPTQTAEEWVSFYSSPPSGVAIASCGPKVIFLTSGTTWTVPADWDSANNTIEAIGGGGGGFSTRGGGGAAYSKTNNLVLTPGSTVTIRIGAGGAPWADGGDTWLSTTGSAPSATSQGVLAKAGRYGDPGPGGSASAGVGHVKYSGGQGAPWGGAGSSNPGGGGGGGAAGPNGNGGAGHTGYPGFTDSGSRNGGGGGGANGGATSAGSNGGTNRLGTGGGVFSSGNGSNGGGGAGGLGKVSPGGTGGSGSQDPVWTETSSGAVAGPGAGGGGGGGASSGTCGYGGVSTGYGGGGGGKGASGCGATAHVDGAGTQGIIVISYGS